MRTVYKRKEKRKSEFILGDINIADRRANHSKAGEEEAMVIKQPG